MVGRSDAPMGAAGMDQQCRNWEALPQDIVQVLGGSYLSPPDVAAARRVSRGWSHGFGSTVRALHLALHPHPPAAMTAVTAAAGGATDPEAATAAAAAAAAAPPSGAVAAGGDASELMALTVQRLQAAFPGVTHIHLHVSSGQQHHPLGSRRQHARAAAPRSIPSQPSGTTSSSSSSSSGAASNGGLGHCLSPQSGYPVTTPEAASTWPGLHAFSPAAVAGAGAGAGACGGGGVMPDGGSSRGPWRVSPSSRVSSSSSSSDSSSRGSSRTSSSSGDGGAGEAVNQVSNSSSTEDHNSSSRSCSPDHLSAGTNPSTSSRSHLFCCGSHQAQGQALTRCLLGELARLTSLRGLVLTADAGVGELPGSPLTRLTQLTQLVLLAPYPPQLLPKLTTALTQLRHLHLGTGDSSGDATTTTWLPASPASVTSGTGSGCVGVAHTQAQLASLAGLSGSLQRLVVVEAAGSGVGPALPAIAALRGLTSLVLLPPGRGQGTLWRGLTPADLASLSSLVNLKELTIPAVIYDSSMTYIHHVPRLAAAYDAALTQALTSMTRLTRMRYILGCTPTDALLAPLAAAGGLQVLVVEAWLQQEAVSRRQVPWRDDTPPLTAEGVSWTSRLVSLHLHLPTWPGGLARVSPLLASPRCVGVTLGPCPQVAEGVVAPLCAASGLERLVFQRVAFPTLSDEGALLASRALSQLLLTLPRLRVLALQLVEGEWSGGALVTDEVLMALRCTAKGLREVIYEVAAVQKRSPWWAGGGPHVVSAAQLSEVGLAALLTHPSVTSVTLACPVTLRQPRWYRPPNQAAVNMDIGARLNSSSSSSNSNSGSSRSVTAAAIPGATTPGSSSTSGSSSHESMPGLAVPPPTGTPSAGSVGTPRSATLSTAQSNTGQLKRLTLCLAVEPLSPAAAAAAAYLSRLACPAAGAAYKRAWRHREAPPGAVMRYRFPAESTLLEQLPPSLTHLTLQLPGLKDAYLAQLATRCPQLQQLTLYVGAGACSPPGTTPGTSSSTGVSVEGLRHLAAATPHLEQLVLLLPPQLATQPLQHHPTWLQQLCTQGCQAAIGRSTVDHLVNPTVNLPLPTGMSQRSGPHVQLLQLLGSTGAAGHSGSGISRSGRGSGQLAWDTSGELVKLGGGGGCGVVHLAKGAGAVADVTQQLQQQYQALQAATQQQQQQQGQGAHPSEQLDVCWEPDAWPRACDRDQCRSKDTGLLTRVSPGLAAGDTEEAAAEAGVHSSSMQRLTSSSCSSSGDTQADVFRLQEGLTEDAHAGGTNSSSRDTSPNTAGSSSSSSAGPSKGTTNNSKAGNITSSSGIRNSTYWSWLAGKPGWQHLVPPGDWSDITGTAGDTAPGCKEDHTSSSSSSWAQGRDPGAGQCGQTGDQVLLTAFLGDYVAEDCGISSSDTSECGWQDV